MKMVIRQTRLCLQEGEVVGEQASEDKTPAEIMGVFRLILANCSKYLKDEDISITQESLELEKLVFKYPGAAGVIEVPFGEPNEK